MNRFYILYNLFLQNPNMQFITLTETHLIDNENESDKLFKEYISIFLLYYFGWEDQYFYMGLFGGCFAVLTILCVNEPSRRRYLDLATIN